MEELQNIELTISHFFVFSKQSLRPSYSLSNYTYTKFAIL